MGEIADKSGINIAKLRKDFPLLQQKERGNPLIYLDSASTTQKPLAVVDAVKHNYLHDNANVHRGIYALSERATAKYEAARQAVRTFMHAKHNHEVIFTRGTTEAINLVANCFARSEVKAGDEILISAMEHHSNIVPWQVLCEQTGAVLKVIPIFDDGSIDMDAYEALLSPKTKLVSVVHVSNVLGTINPVKEMTTLAHAMGVPILIDGAQAMPHIKVDVADLDCDFYAFSAHKMYGPTGVGVLYGKTEWLEKLPPYQTGGDMIKTVSFEKTEYNVLPHKFEAGTPNIAGVIGLGEAINYLQQYPTIDITNYEHELLHYATACLKDIPGLRIIGTAAKKSAVISFVMSDAHPHDISTILDSEGIAIRAGHHCAMPLMQRFQVPATARISLGIYNTQEEIDAVVKALQKVIQIFNG